MFMVLRAIRMTIICLIGKLRTKISSIQGEIQYGMNKSILNEIPYSQKEILKENFTKKPYEQKMHFSKNNIYQSISFGILSLRNFSTCKYKNCCSLGEEDRIATQRIVLLHN